ncbi:hypothetical protein [Pseudomonas sp. FSL R10-2398]|uniref:hypothetical protein n=1 Tax=Pseudomonas sp. FSL R10-2398 TaxID=2662201 RepID=UPI001295AEA5|nr:hypothetical protein [Pseudomonas sp. FSL R10-2398]MQT50881.1 hypothetical protein [Pseudomonas sp. FSL R10-2398]
MAKKRILIFVLLFCVKANAENFIPENQVQAALLGLNMLGQSELLCYKDLKIDYSSVAKR